MNYDTGVTLTNGGAVPNVITFSNTNLSKVSFVIHSANGVPQIAEFEVYNGYTDGNNGNPTNTQVNGTYRITPKHSGASLDIANCQSEDGANVRQWSWLNNDCQKFNISTVNISFKISFRQLVIVKNSALIFIFFFHVFLL